MEMVFVMFVAVVVRTSRALSGRFVKTFNNTAVVSVSNLMSPFFYVLVNFQYRSLLHKTAFN
jgi:hypothetical protein